MIVIIIIVRRSISHYCARAPTRPDGRRPILTFLALGALGEAEFAEAEARFQGLLSRMRLG